jgi:dATP/dGTP diphosphohydrolase, N-terminal
MTKIPIKTCCDQKGPLPQDYTARKQLPVGTGVLDYFPDALIAVAEVSFAGNQQHNPGEPLHWARGKSTDHADTMIRHYMERGTKDTDGTRHSAKMVWRALALLQEEIEAERVEGYKSRGSR